MDPLQLVVLALATAASSLIKNGAAVGSGIFLLPVLALVFPPKIALGLGAPVMLASDLMGIRNYWGEWDDWHEILRIILAASVGIALGGYLIHILPPQVFKRAIGVFAITFALFQLLKDVGRLPRALSLPRSLAIPPQGGMVPSLLIGGLGGLATVLAHAGGMVWSIYYVGRRMEKRRFVATMILLFALSNAIKMGTYMQMGILSLRSTLIVVAMTPVIILSSNLGNRLNRRINPTLFRRIVLLLILVLGGSLIF